MTGLQILHTGPLALVQDLGRIGHLRSGVGVSGAADRRSLRLANRLLGNPENAAGLEILLGGLTLRAHGPSAITFTGAHAQAYVDELPVGHASVIDLRDGQTARLDFAHTGLRTYVGVRGGVAVPPVLGSRSTDTLSGIGPLPLNPNDVLPIGPSPTSIPLVDFAPVGEIPGGALDLRVLFGPRADWFLNPRDLTVGGWAVSPDSDRIGVRLERVGGGPLLRRVDSTELASEGVALGSIQVPPSGQPVVFLADHPVTGGYPVIGVLTDADIDRIAQARPGQGIRFS